MTDTTGIEKELETLFTSVRHGVKLSSKLAENIGYFLIKTAKVKSLDEVATDDPDEMEVCATAAWLDQEKEELPTMLAYRVRKWSGEAKISGKSTKEEPLAGSDVQAISEDARRQAASKEVALADLTIHQKEKAVRDMMAQNLSCARIIWLCLSLHLGRVVKGNAASDDMKFGEDPALTQLAKEARKAGKNTLTVILREKVFSNASAFFTDLMSKYAAESMVEESSLIGAWWAETVGCFASDKDMIFEYLNQYFEKYAGRGLPIMLDAGLVIRMRSFGQMGGGSKDEISKLKAKIEAMETKLTKVHADINTLQQKVGKKKEEDAATRRANVTCHNCGKKGHYESECPEPKKE